MNAKTSWGALPWHTVALAKGGEVSWRGFGFGVALDGLVWFGFGWVGLVGLSWVG